MKVFVSASLLCSRWIGSLSLILLLAACGTTAPQSASSTEAKLASAGTGLPLGGSTDILRPGDLVLITFAGISDPLPKHEERIKEDGTITLTHIGPVQAAGKTRSELEQIIEREYVPKYYTRMTVRVAPEHRWFYVYGEVNNPNKHPYLGEMTVLRAIAAAGDFTNFAKKKDVELTRADGRKVRVNCVKAQRNPQLDLPVYPEDMIMVPRRLF